jgi:hypothetical protein
MICEHCENGLGQTTRIVLDPVPALITETCRHCGGVGFMCERCLDNSTLCGCPDDEQVPPPPRRET